MTELLINGNNALTKYGVRMGKGFITALRAPASYKDMVSSSSRNEHGTRYVVDNIRFDEREVTLPFVIIGASSSNAKEKESAFLSDMKGKVSINVPTDSTDVYHLIPISFSGYKINLRRNIISVSVKFKEPNPNDRT